MEESKYYTPEIEEFHVGFEYEYYEPQEVTISNAAWEKIVFSPNDGIIENYKYNIDAIRVKHLDREDIESFNFELLKKDINGKAYKHKDNDELQIWWSNNGIIDIDNGRTYEDCITYFKGTIKNKSELQRVLKMIGI